MHGVQQPFRLERAVATPPRGCKVVVQDLGFTSVYLEIGWEMKLCAHSRKRARIKEFTEYVVTMLLQLCCRSQQYTLLLYSYHAFCVFLSSQTVQTRHCNYSQHYNTAGASQLISVFWCCTTSTSDCAR